VCCSAWQCVAVCDSVLQALQSAKYESQVCCSALQRVAVCGSAERQG